MTPNLRFQEFQDDFNSDKLGQLITSFSGGTPSASNKAYYDGDIPFIKSGEINDAKTEQFINEIALANSSAKIVNKGDLLLALYGATSGEIAISKLEGAINQAVLCIRSERLNLEYLKFWFELNKEKILGKYLQGGQGNLSASIVKSLIIRYPSLDEQLKTAVTLKSVDQKINLLTKKKEALETYKKGLMQKIFSQELRFRREDGTGYTSWKESSLKSCLREITVPMRDKPKEFGGSTDWCRIEDIKCGYINGSRAGLKVSDNCIADMNLKVLPVGSVIVSCSAYLGICARVTKPLITNQTFIGLFPGSEITTEFLYYTMSSKERELNRLASGTTISYLSRREFEDLTVKLPGIDEQNKITGLLNSADVKLELVESQIKKTLNLKKGILQQMFV